jgi:hypothetical protein
MARLPSALDLSGPASLRSGRQYASADTTDIGRGMAGLGAGIASVGADIQAANEEKRREDIALDGTAADGNTVRDLYDLERQFDEDADHGTFGKRFDTEAAKIRDKWASGISDPKAKELWTAQFTERSAAARNRVLGLAEKRNRETRLVSAKSGLEGYQTIIANPDVPSEERDYAKRNADASITALESAGTLSASEADEWRDKVIRGGEFVLGEREIQRDPGVITGKLPASVSERAGAAMSFFQSQGWTKEQAAGIVGNLMGESKLNTGARNPGDGVDGSDSIGIGQWNGSRARALKAYAGERGLDWRDFGVQLAFVNEELNGSERGAGNALRGAKTIDEATAAFIGYERPAGWSANNPRGGHNYKGRLKFAAQAAGEKVMPEWFTNQTAEDQYRLEVKAESQQRENDTAAAAQNKASYDTYKDALGLSILTGGVQTERTIINDPILNDGDKTTLLRSFRTEMEDTIATAAAIQQFAGGALRVDPFDEKGRKTVDNVDAALVKAVPPEQLQTAREDLVRQSGVVPKSFLSTIRQGLESTNIADVVAAAQQAQRLLAINPAALSRRDGGSSVQSAADDFSHYVNNLNLPAEQAAQRLMDARDPAKKLSRKAIEPAAKEFVKGLEKESFSSQFDTLLGSEPDLGFTPGQALGIQAEFIAIAEDQFYAANGDPEIAKNRAVEEMKRLYGVTELTGRKVVMKHPPERYWPNYAISDAAQSLSYPTQLENDIREFSPDLDMGTVQLVTTPATDAMVKRGEMPGYAVMWTDENGVLQTIPGKLWRPDISKLSDMQQRVDEVEQQQRLDAAKGDQVQERQQAPYRVQKPEDFMSGTDPVFGARDDVAVSPLAGEEAEPPKAPESDVGPEIMAVP